jgi:Domain of unknown function (DUF4332)
MTRSHWPIMALPGIDAKTAADLTAVGISDTQQLLAWASIKIENPNSNHQQLAAIIGTRPGRKLLALAQLAQIPSVGCQYCGLLLHAGVASIEQLSQTPPAQLHQLVLRLHVALLQRRDLTPRIDQVQNWVQQAKAILHN